MENNIGKEIIEIKNQIVKEFEKEEWLELGLILNCEHTISNHPRLLKSLLYRDPDYAGNALEVIRKIIDKDSKNLLRIKDYLLHRNSEIPVSEFVSTASPEIPKRIIQFSPQVFDIPKKELNQYLVAVMLPFNKEFEEVFNTIKEACLEVGLECLKANDIWENSTIVQDIFELIFISRIVIADFTGKNPNVFYEVGIAHTLGKTVIPITQSIDDIPADLRPHRVLKYHDNLEGRLELKQGLITRLNTLKPKESFEW